MSEPAADLSATVDYSMDRWLVEQVPLAMWSCVAGLGVILNAGGGVIRGASMALVYLALLGLAFASWAATTIIERRTPFLVGLAIGAGIAVVVVLVILLSVGTVGSSFPRGTLWWSGLVDPPINVFGWMLLYLGIGYTAYALLRHRRPGTPVVRLSPSGVVIHRSWLRDLRIPWQEIRAVDYLDTSRVGEPVSRNRHAIMIATSTDFYEQYIAPKRSFLAPPGSELMFQPRGAIMQIVLTSPDVLVAAEDYRLPIETRWKAFRDLPMPPDWINGSGGGSVMFGRWSFDRSPWQTVKFMSPIVGAAGVLLHASSRWLA